MFPPVDKDKTFPQREEAILDFWKENGIYEKTLAARADAPPFVFYEGPPTANGMPHPGHCLTRAIKDLFPRYKTMRGYRCERKAGWDTHGLPVEVEVCKELGIHSKEEIENYGIEPFIQLCQKSVWRYMQEWERLTERLGFWVNLEDAYVTYHQSYVESVWWSLKQLHERGLLYQGHKIVWWWAQGGTALSAGEVGQGYREVADPSVFVKFPLLEDGQVSKTSLVVWTTTPWTLPSNQFAAVHPEIEYATVEDTETGELLILASDLVEAIATKSKRELKVIATCQGQELVGRRYVPPFETYYTLAGAQHRQTLRKEGVPFKLGGAQRGKLADGSEDYLAWRVVAADFVTTDSGSGVVHQAPAFGEVDYDVLVAEQARFASGEGPTLINCVGPDGKFTEEAPVFVRGRWVKDCDKDINRDLKERGLLFHQEQYLHDYPFCWRAEEDPLIQYPRESWFIKTTAFKDAMLENNAQINWLPEHIKDGRFGKFLESNVDWALSRERFWGTPLPVWQCEVCSRQGAVGSYEELLEKPGVTGTEVWDEAKKVNPELPDDLRVHKPYIDAIKFECPDCKGTGGSTMHRVPEVIDCWYDSGAMPFAQWGYRGQESGPERDRFENQFPADFISEALDQTRGWFYSQVAISTMLWGNDEARMTNDERKSNSSFDPRHSSYDFPHPFKNCIVLGLMLGEDGQKMSKSKRNYRAPGEIFDLYGADALRWYFFANQPPWTSIRYSEQAIKDSVPEFLLRLWNVYSFFTIYANIDEFEPQALSAPSNKHSAGIDPEKGSPTLFDDQFAGDETYRAAAKRGELDRWILSELNRTLATLVERMDDYDNYNACQAIIAFVDALSNWYVRRSRDRFWAKDKQDRGKLDAYWTLYECLLTTTKMIAPFVPFLAESLWQQLAALPSSKTSASGAANVEESVHLCSYPESDDEAIDETLSERMDLVRLISSLGRNARTSAELKVRQPLAKVEVILADPAHQAWLAEHAAVIEEELNVKAVEFSDRPEQYVDYQVLPNFKLLGKKLGKLMPKVKQALGKADGAALLAEMKANDKVTLDVEGETVELNDEEIEVRIAAKQGWAAANDRGVVVVLATELTEELVAEGLARDLVRVIQDRRKELGCEFTDRIGVTLDTDDQIISVAIDKFGDYVAAETLADSVSCASIESAKPFTAKIGDATVQLLIQRVEAEAKSG